MTQPHLLVVDDNEVDRMLIRRLLGAGYAVLEASTAAEAVRLTDEGQIDCVLLDHRLPDMDGVEVLEEFGRRQLPVVMLTGQGDETLAVEAMKRGAQDYIGKARLNPDLLQRAVTNALEKASLQTQLETQVLELERKQAELEASNRALKEREAKLSLVLERLPAAVWTTSGDLWCTSLSGSRQRAFVSAGERAVGEPVDRLFAQVEERDVMINAHRAALDGEASRLDAKIADQLYQCHVERFVEPGGAPGVIGIAVDVSEARNLERQLRQAQKLEAIGTLAGGLAHDFNNILTVVLSFAQLAGEGLGEEDAAREDLKEIATAAGRGAELVKHLLAFSRQRTAQPASLDINETIRSLLPMLRRLLGEDTPCSFEPEEVLWETWIDRGGIEQVIVNLAVNARDAMPDGGRVVIATENLSLGEWMGGRKPIEPGDYVCLSVSDEGRGIPEELREKMFEPFFTTKEVGRGTGLGLSTCYGIVKQAGGEISVYSEEGRGTTFRVFLPRSREKHEASAPARGPATAAGGTETLLVVEDDEQVRGLAARVLRGYGYHVLEAKEASQALELCARQEEDIRLVLSDVVMPGMSGPDLAEEILARRPGTVVLFMSGYANAALRHRALVSPDARVVNKPFVPERLASAVREALDRPEPAGDQAPARPPSPEPG